MENLEDAAKDAANRWNDRITAKEEMREIAFEMLKTKNMTQVAKIIGISRTSLYYFLYGKHGKAHTLARKNDTDLRLHDAELQLRESA